MFQDLMLRLRRVWPVILLILGCVYFGYHTFSGNRGIMRLAEVTKKLEENKQLAAKIALEKESLQNEVKALSSSSLDLDKLEEESIKLLNFGTADDFIIVDAIGEEDGPK